jgi:hypothetical protein
MTEADVSPLAMTARGDELSSRLAVEVDAVPPQYRWILQRYRSLVGTRLDTAVTPAEVMLLTVADLANVKGVGPLRAQRTIDSLRALLQLAPAALAATIQLPTTAIEGAVCGGEVVLDALDQRYRWILDRLLATLPDGDRKTVPQSFLEELRVEDFLRVPGVGPLRAERAAQYFRTVLESQPTDATLPASTPRGLSTLPDGNELPALLRDAVGHVQLPLRLFPGPLRTALSRLELPSHDARISLGGVMALTESYFIAHGAYSNAEAADLISLRDDLLSAAAIHKCIADSPKRDLVLVLALVQLAIEAKWAFADWANEAGIAENKLLDLVAESRDLSAPPLDSRVGVYLLDLTVAQRVLRGESLEQVGRAFGVTRERIRQRIARVGVTGRLARAAHRLARDSIHQYFQPRVDQYVMTHPGCYYYEITDATECSIEDVETFARGVRWLVLDANEDEESANESLPSVLETRRRSVVALQHAATFCFPVSSKAYTSLLRDTYIEGPSAVRIIQVFGTWRTACDAAGVESGQTGTQPGHAAIFSSEDVLHSVSSFLLDRECAGASNQYDDWRSRQTNGEDLPSFGTIRKVLGPSWAVVRRRALLHLRRRWTNRS